MWERGGEFAKYETEAELESEWLKGDAILQKLQATQESTSYRRSML